MWRRRFWNTELGYLCALRLILIQRPRKDCPSLGRCSLAPAMLLGWEFRVWLELVVLGFVFCHLRQLLKGFPSSDVDCSNMPCSWTLVGRFDLVKTGLAFVSLVLARSDDLKYLSVLYRLRVIIPTQWPTAPPCVHFTCFVT